MKQDKDNTKRCNGCIARGRGLDGKNLYWIHKKGTSGEYREKYFR